MSAQTLEPGDVVQIDPTHDETFGGAFMVITETKTWGAQGYVPMGTYMLQKEGDEAKVLGAKQAYYRCPHSAMTYIGQAVWDTDHTES